MFNNNNSSSLHSKAISKIRFHVVCVDDDIIVVNKPSGMKCVQWKSEQWLW